MTRTLHRLVLAAVLGAGGLAQAAELRLANGANVKAEAREAKAEGLLVAEGGQTRVLPWNTLSYGTRYRYEPGLRMNFDALLEGRPAAARTLAPDPKYNPFAPGGEAAAPAEAPLPALLSERSQLAKGDEPTLLASTALPGLGLKNSAEAWYAALQYGPGKDQAVFFAFDRPAPNALPESLYTYDRAKAAQGMEPAQRSADGTRLTFPPRTLQASFGGVAATYTLQWTQGTNDRLPGLTVDVELRAAAEKWTYQLAGRPAHLGPARGPIRPAPLLVPPALIFRLEPAGGGPRWVGRMVSAQMNMRPGEGMARECTVRVLDPAGKAILEEQVPFPSDPAQPLATREVPGVSEGQMLSIQAKAVMGGLFGSVQFQDRALYVK